MSSGLLQLSGQGHALIAVVPNAWPALASFCRLGQKRNMPLPSKGAVGQDFLFVEDNSRLHRSIEVSDALQKENILRMQWSAYCLNLNLIEHAWNAPGRHVAQKTISPPTMPELKITLREKWDNIPQRLLDGLEKSTELIQNVH
ncbi:transposable element Tc3 transposase [Trichonephila clavipes]|nr:transposable element Tc3 transposase [Trichonephila clavipes]